MGVAPLAGSAGRNTHAPAAFPAHAVAPLAGSAGRNLAFHIDIPHAFGRSPDVYKRQVMNGGDDDLYIATSQDIAQRASTVLQDVRYVIEAHFDMTDHANPSDNPGKFQDIIKRRLDRGQCYHTPYLGCREFPAHFERWQGGKIPTIPETRDLGLMLYDFDYSNPEDIQPTYFRAKMVNGVISVADCEVLR